MSDTAEQAPAVKEQSVSEKPAVERADGMVLEGSIKVWNISKGFGFASVEDGGGDLFVHQSAVQVENNRFRAILPGTTVALVYQKRDGNETASSCTGKDGAPLPGFSSKLEATQQIQGGVDAQVDIPGMPGNPNMGGAALGLPAGMYSGTMKFWNQDKGFGFVVPDGGGADVFVHIRDVDNMQVLATGDHVTFKLERKNQGPRPQAVNVSKGPASNQAAASYDPYGGAGGAAPYGYAPQGYPQQPAYSPYGGGAGYGAPAGAYGAPAGGAGGYGGAPDYSQSGYSPYGAPASQGGYNAPSGGVDAYGMPLPATTQAPGATPAHGGQQTGTCKWFNEEKGFGFIIPGSGGPDIYFKGQDVNAATTLMENEPVQYELKIAPDGKQWAQMVSRIDNVGGKRKMGGADAPHAGAYGASMHDPNKRQAMPAAGGSYPSYH